MSKPAILTADDDPAVAAVTAGDPRRRCPGGGSIVRTASGREARPVLDRPAPHRSLAAI
jgi:hypothetical protein